MPALRHKLETIEVFLEFKISCNLRKQYQLIYEIGPIQAGISLRYSWVSKRHRICWLTSVASHQLRRTTRVREFDTAYPYPSLSPTQYVPKCTPLILHTARF